MKYIARITEKDVCGRDGVSSAAPRLAARAVLFDESNRIAVVHSVNTGLYSLAGGGIESGETPESAAEREVLEETGCKCELLYPLGIIEENRASYDFTQVSYYFVARVIGIKGTPIPTEGEKRDGDVLEWMNADELYLICANAKYDTLQKSFIARRDLCALRELFRWEYKERWLYCSAPSYTSAVAYHKAVSGKLPASVTVKPLWSGASEGEVYFKLKHDLKSIPAFPLCEGLHIRRIAPNEEAGAVAELINRCYPSTELSAEEVEGWAHSSAYDPSLWLGAYNESGELAAAAICEYGREAREGSLEWIQTLPEYRSCGVASALVSYALSEMKKSCAFATVSGRQNDGCNPRALYEKCGFRYPMLWDVVRS